MVQRGADLTKKDKENRSVMEIAIELNHDLALFLINAGAFKCQPLSDQKKIFLRAIEKDYADIVELLVHYFSSDDIPKDALFSAINHSNSVIFKLLFAIFSGRGDESFKAEGLIKACAQGNKDIVEFLIENGAEVNRPFDNDTALIKACESGNDRLVVYLIEKKADVNQSGIFF